MSELAFRNKTVFFAPVWTDDYKGLLSALQKDERYTLCSKKIAPQYMLPYIDRIYRDDDLFIKFALKAEHLPPLCMQGARESFSSPPVLTLPSKLE